MRRITLHNKIVSVDKWREEGRFEGWTKEEIKEFVIYQRTLRKRRKQQTKNKFFDVEEQKQVLERMRKRGCSKCEEKRQENWIKKLKQ